VFSPILGPLSDRIGRKKMMGIGMIIFSVSSFATAISSNFVLILFARSVTGIGAAFAAPNVWSFIGDTFEYRERGKITAIVASALSLGMILGVPIGSSLAQWKSWEISFYVLAVISLLIGALIYITFPASGISKSDSKIKYSRQFSQVLGQRNILFSFIVTLLISLGNFGLYTYLGYWLNKCFSLKVSTIGLFMIIAGIGNLLGMQAGGILSDKFGKKKVVIISLLILMISLFLLPLLRVNIILTVIDIFIWLGSGGASFSVMQVIVTQLNPKSRGTIMALNNSFMWTGTAVGSALLSLLIKHATFFVASLMCSFGVLLAGFILLTFIKTDESY
jgi:multidrug resistance protein